MEIKRNNHIKKIINRIKYLSIGFRLNFKTFFLLTYAKQLFMQRNSIFQRNQVFKGVQFKVEIDYRDQLFKYEIRSYEHSRTRYNEHSSSLYRGSTLLFYLMMNFIYLIYKRILFIFVKDTYFNLHV